MSKRSIFLFVFARQGRETGPGLTKYGYMVIYVEALNFIRILKIMNNIPSKSKAQEKVQFVSALEALVSELPKRSQEIVWGRFGVGGAKAATLEEIGKKFNITRERVRQVIREVCKKVKSKENSPVLAEIRKKIAFTLEANSGIIEERSMLEKLGNGNDAEIGAARFFLECLDDAKSIEIKGVTEKTFASANFKEESWKKNKNRAIEILKEKNSPQEENSLFEEFSKKEEFKDVDKKKFFDFISVSLEIKKNTFGKWGLSEWKEIKPKGTKDKAYLVLKEKGEPMHFKEIAEGIDKSGLNKKKTHPQTVHNELIKDKKFVLVGRGIYALSEWGYKKGTVKDVLEDILDKNPKGLKKDEVISEVLKVRQVKKSTIVINLNNFFKKNKEGFYCLKK